jgi:hypothetical protein
MRLIRHEGGAEGLIKVPSTQAVGAELRDKLLHLARSKDTNTYYCIQALDQLVSRPLI